MIYLYHDNAALKAELNITGSKSESNRWLILKAIFVNHIKIHNLSNAKDTQLLEKALGSNAGEINIGHAGTAMRFLTAYLAMQRGRAVLLTGSDRMKERPIQPLVNALLDLGANIQYAEKEGYPPLLIQGTDIFKDEVHIQADVSSQYITALMLISPCLPNGLNIYFKGKLTSRPYIEMTKAQLESLGIQVDWLENGIQVKPYRLDKKHEAFVESDWSSASYWYSIIALADEGDIHLKIYKENSLQGDAVLQTVYKKYFGVKTEFYQGKIQLSKIAGFQLPTSFELNLNHAPDIAQTIIVTCAGLGIKAKLTGLKTLKVKETDRLLALHQELKKVGVTTTIDEDSIAITSFDKLDGIPTIATYQDHRMAMCFAPLALRFPIQIEEEDVVVKSYPSFWEDLKKVGFSIASK